MPTVIMTWVGLLGVVLIIDGFRKQEERRTRRPLRKTVGANLKSALEGIPAFAMADLVDKPPDSVDIAKLVRDANSLELWRWQDLDSTRSNWHTTLQVTGTRLTKFVETWAIYLEPDERERIEQLKDYALDKAGNSGPWTWPLGEGADVEVRGQVFVTWRDAVSRFCAVAEEVYKPMTGSALTGTSDDFERVFPYRLGA